MQESLQDIIQNNELMSTKSKVRIYKTSVRPIVRYASETQAEISTTKQLIRSAEIKTSRTIKGVTLRGHIWSSTIREALQTEDVVR